MGKLLDGIVIATTIPLDGNGIGTIHRYILRRW